MGGDEVPLNRSLWPHRLTWWKDLQSGCHGNYGPELSKVDHWGIVTPWRYLVWQS